MLSNPYQFDDDACPVCEHTLNAASATDDVSDTPEPGDVTICAYCTCVLTYDDNMRVQLFPEDELKELGEEVNYAIQKIQQTLRVVRH